MTRPSARSQPHLVLLEVRRVLLARAQAAPHVLEALQGQRVTLCECALLLDSCSRRLHDSAPPWHSLKRAQGWGWWSGRLHSRGSGDVRMWRLGRRTGVARWFAQRLAAGGASPRCLVTCCLVGGTGQPPRRFSCGQRGRRNGEQGPEPSGQLPRRLGAHDQLSSDGR